MNRLLLPILTLSAGAIGGGFHFTYENRNFIRFLMQDAVDIIDLKGELTNKWDEIVKKMKEIEGKSSGAWPIMLEMMRINFFVKGAESWLDMDFWEGERYKKKLSDVEDIVMHLIGKEDQDKKKIKKRSTDSLITMDDLTTLSDLSEEFADIVEALYEKCFRLFKDPFEKYSSKVRDLGYYNVDSKQLPKLVSIQEKLYFLVNHGNAESQKSDLVSKEKENFIFKNIAFSGKLVTNDSVFLNILKKYDNIFKLDNSSKLTINLDLQYPQIYNFFEFGKEEQEGRITLSFWKSLVNTDSTPETIKQLIKQKSDNKK